MSPKTWSNTVTITERQIQEIIYENQKLVERLAWKSMSPLEFGESMLEMMKSLAKQSVRLNFQEFRSALSKTKVAITCDEADLLIEKVKVCIKVVKQRLRDCGSGKFLPPIAVALNRIWKKHEKPIKKKKKKEEAGQSSKGVCIRDVFGLPPKQEPEHISLLSTESEDWTNFTG